MVPAMEEEGYDRGFAAATTAAGGLLAPVIPPSMLFVIYGVLAQIPIGDMFLAGILPGLILSVFFAVVIALIGLWQQYPKGEWLAASEAWAAIKYALPALLIPAAIIGGIIGGVATPTESAAVASVVAFLLGWLLYRELKPEKLFEMFRRTAMNAALIIFMIAAANVFGWVIIYEAVPQRLAAFITTITENPFLFLLIVNLVLLFVGMVIDGIAAIILVTPILLPIAIDSYGISPYQFGVVISLNLVLGLLTPPGWGWPLYRQFHGAGGYRRDPQGAVAVPSGGDSGVDHAQLLARLVAIPDRVGTTRHGPFRRSAPCSSFPPPLATPSTTSGRWATSDLRRDG